MSTNGGLDERALSHQGNSCSLKIRLHCRLSVENDLPGSDVASAIDCVVIHGCDKSIVKLL